jgi:hypothetical protein
MTASPRFTTPETIGPPKPRKGHVGTQHVLDRQDGDALLALGLEAVGEEGELERRTSPDAGAVGLQGRQLGRVDGLRVVEKVADERGLPVVDTADGGEAQELLPAIGRDG